MVGKQLRRVAITTGGGDCPGLNAVIRAFVKTAHTAFDWEIVGIADGLDGLFLPDGIRRLGEEDVRGLISRGGTILGTSNRGNPFRQTVVVDGQEQVLDRSDRVMARFEELGIDALLLIGGEGTMKIALQIQQLGLPVVGVPKTIDNDLSATDLTFGFDTAVRTATEAIDKLQSTAESHHRVMVLEVMGRHAGWIALESGIAGGVEIILIPELPFRVERVAHHVNERIRRGRRFSLVVAAEGAYPVGGAPIRAHAGGPTSQARLGGIGLWLAEQLGQQTSHEVRATILGHLQRGGSPSPFDRVLATRFGCAAAWLVGRGDWGKMVALQGSTIVPVEIADAVGTYKSVPPGGDRVTTARHLGICFGD